MCCNNNCCYNLTIKQIYCQNGIPRTEYISLNNISKITSVNLNFGYSITISSINESDITIIINDSIFNIPSQIIEIPCDSYKMISLPAQSGTFRIYIVFQSYFCCN